MEEDQLRLYRKLVSATESQSPRRYLARRGNCQDYQAIIVRSAWKPPAYVDTISEEARRIPRIALLGIIRRWGWGKAAFIDGLFGLDH